MDISSIGSMYLQNRALPSSTGRESDGEASFASMLKAAAKSQMKAESPISAPAAPVKAVGLPVGAAANSTAIDQAHAAKHKVSVDRTSKLYEQCQALEGFIVKELLNGMRKTVEKGGGLVDEGFAGNMYEDMLYDEYSKSLTKTAGFGLADQAYLELSGQIHRA